MRRLLSIAFFFLCGCDFSSPRNPFSQEITDRSGTHRLALLYVPAAPGPEPGSETFAFESLIWRSKAGTNWTHRAVITKAEFEAGSSTQRWISEIHSLDPNSGNAVIKVAEVSPFTNGASICVYSWREWNLLTNHEVRLLRVCKEPFEPFKGKRIKLFK